MKTLTREQAEAIEAFIEAFELTTSGAWTAIEQCMREMFGISDPEEALEEARQALRDVRW